MNQVRCVRRARADDRDPLLQLWERSVRATHHFLEDRDVVALRPFVAEELASDTVDWWVLESTTGALMGFLGYTRDTIEGLFIDPDYRHQGGGKALVAHAEALSAGPLAVAVNEQNDAATRFYTALGFTAVGRSATDASGRPFPILHMSRPVPASAAAPNGVTNHHSAHIAANCRSTAL